MDIGFARKCQRAHPRAYWGEPFPIASSTLMSHFFRFLAALGLMLGLFSEAADPIKIVLVAGTVKEVDKPGHHDYTGGCEVMKHLLEQTKGVSVSYIKEGWPQGENRFRRRQCDCFLHRWRRQTGLPRLPRADHCDSKANRSRRGAGQHSSGS